MKDCEIITGDCRGVLPTLGPQGAELVFFDPPFNIGLDYPGYRDSREQLEYLDWLEGILGDVLGVMVPTGSLWVQCGQTIQADMWGMLKTLGLHWRNTVIWHYTFGPHQKKKFVPSWQALHWFTLSPNSFTFNADAIRVPSARQQKYRDKRANPKGRIPDDVWTISRICGTFRERVDHSCQTPLELAERVLLACSNPGDLILDPMCGTGTLGVAARKLGRRFLGIELCEATADAARKRIETALEPAVT